MSTPEERIETLEARINTLQTENSALQSKLLGFKSLDEELTAKRIFDSAYKRLISYLTFGGFFTLAVGFIGYKSISAFVEEQAVKVATKMDSTAVTKIAIEQIKTQAAAINKREFTKLTRKLNDTAATILKYTSSKMTTLSEPTKGVSAKSSKINPVSSNKILPAIVDLSSQLGVVRNTGLEGSVTGFVLADVLAALAKTQLHKDIVFSPRYIYNNINNHRDGGAFLQNGLDFIKRTGGIPERYWPYIAGQPALATPLQAKNAPHYKIKSYLAINLSVQTVKNELALGKMVIAGMTFYAEYQKDPNLAILPLYKSNFTPTGGTAVNIVGYDDNRKLLKLRLSWGSEFGAKGYVFLNYDDFGKIVTEAFIVDGIDQRN